VSFDFEKGKVYAIRGRSGSGKTTLLSLISGLERCTEGKIVFNGKNLENVNLDYYRSHDIGIVFQSYNLLPFMTASENIILSMDASGSKAKIADKKQKAIELMKSVGLKENYADRKVLRLSGGEQQRVAIARSLSYNPKMIVADEPTGNLDKKTEEEILKIFKKLAHKDGKCVIIVTHSANVCEKVDKVFDLKRVKK
jgi:putative ABC transport system ATP-binding protein